MLRGRLAGMGRGRGSETSRVLCLDPNSKVEGPEGPVPLARFGLGAHVAAFA